MTRIYTNVPSMIARTNLNKNMSALQTSLERLSTGFKINSGKDDPAGLIASEMLRSDITGIKVAIKNTERANMMIATADSALNEVTNLLNDIRGLVTEAASTGTMSAEMIAANQLQIDASLDAIDRIAAQTTFMGQKLLDGSLDFNLTGVDRNNLQGLAVNQATFPADKAPLPVSINVREAAEKAALYFNKPALAESIVLRWGGNYGFSMQTFEKGATVTEIADIINRASDATGVAAEVGSDAIAGMLYVSSLGPDNDMIIRSGIAGLNSGNVEIKYLKGTSDGVQVKYEEPAYAGAPAKILVYLQTEAYNAAAAKAVDTSTASNNALEFIANIEGAQYNNSSIQYVDGSLFDPNFYNEYNKTGTAGQPYAYYSDNGQVAAALFGNVPDGNSATKNPSSNINGTGGASGTAFMVTESGGITRTLNDGEYFTIQSKSASTAYNNVSVRFESVAVGSTLLGGQNAAALYTEQKDIYGNIIEGGKILTVYVKDDGSSTLQDVQDALKLERHIGASGTQEVGAFELKSSIGGAASLSSVSVRPPAVGGGVQNIADSNTHNSGGAAGTLFIVIPPDGKLPARPGVREVVGVTEKAVADTYYLAHTDSSWDNYTLELEKLNAATPQGPPPAPKVSVELKGNTVSVKAYNDATYEDILKAINDPAWNNIANVNTKPAGLSSLYWSDAYGVPKTPGAPTSLAAKAETGIIGLSNFAVDGSLLYLKHSNPALNDFNINFSSTGVANSHNVTVNVSGKTLTVSYDSAATYDDIINALNAANWANGNNPAAAGGTQNIVDAQGKTITVVTSGFTWTDSKGQNKNVNAAVGTASAGQAAASLKGINTGTLSAKSNVAIGDGYYLNHIDSGADGFTINFTPDKNHTGRGGQIFIVYDNTSKTISVVADADATYDQILAALNTPTGPGSVWQDASTGNPVNPNPFGTAGSPIFTWVNAAGTQVQPGIPVSLVQSTKTGIYTPPQVSLDGRSTLIANEDLNNDGKTDTNEGIYLYHDDPQWDNKTVKFDPTGIYDPLFGDLWLAGVVGSPTPSLTSVSTNVLVSYDGKQITVTYNNSATYEEILAALNATQGDSVASIPQWHITTAGVTVPPSADTSKGEYHFKYVDQNGVDTKGATALNSKSAGYDGSGTAMDTAAAYFGNSGAALLETAGTNPWAGYTMTFVSGTTAGITHNGKTITVTYTASDTYSSVATAINTYFATGGGGASLGLGTLTGNTAWTTNGSNPFTFTGSVTFSTPVNSGVLTSKGSGATLDELTFAHGDSSWNNYTIEIVSSGNSGNSTPVVTVHCDGNTVRVTADEDAAYDDILTALNDPSTWTGTGTRPAADGLSFAHSNATVGNHIDTTDAWYSVTQTTITVNLNSTKVSTAPSAAINKIIGTGAVVRDITANDIAAIFDLTNPMSRGSERAASLFTVKTTIDNDGTGLIRLYDYWVDKNGNLLNGIGIESNGDKKITTRTAFEKVMQGGVTGGGVITTAAELVTVLNNSAYWSMVMCPELIAELAKENLADKYYDATNPPVITAQLAPGNHGLFAVSTFEEVAYYGDPDVGNALQFLGGTNSPNIRFVAEGVNTPLSIDRTTVPAELSFSQAVLTAQDSGASLTITAVKKGGDYDDVQFVFKRMSEDMKQIQSPDRKDGFVEYDPGRSRAYAQAVFKDAATNAPVANTAFFITADERGDVYNNCAVMMRIDDVMVDDQDGLQDGITVAYDSKTNQLRVSVAGTKANSVTTNDIIAAINNAKCGFSAELSFAESPTNDGTGKLSNIGLSTSRYVQIANMGETGGHTGGTVTVWLADEEVSGPGDGVYNQPNQEDIVRLINSDPVVGRLFTAKAYNTVQTTDGKLIDFVKDGPIVSKGGLISPAVITVHLATDQHGNVLTTAKDLETWWNQQDPALVDNISVSIVRPVGAVWDECNDPYGNGLLGPTVSRGDCDQWIINDIQFVGWNDNVEQQHYVATKATGTMTSQRGINSSYQLIARNLGPEYNGYTIEYISDDTLTGHFADNLVAGAGLNPCEDDPYSGLQRDDCGNLITPNSSVEKGLRLVFDEATKKITIYGKIGVTTANDVEQIIENDPRTKNLFEVVQLGDGTGLIDSEDDTLLTKDGALPPGNLNGAKLLFGSDATDYYLVLKSTGYGSEQFVSVQATAKDGGSTTFEMSDSTGQKSEKSYGKDVDALINGMKASGKGLDVSLNTSSLSLDFTFAETAGTTAGWSTGFTITGGGATFQVGPDVVSKQQITMGIRSINTVLLGGATGVLNELRSGQSAELTSDTNKAFRIVEESLLAITSVRGRLGTMQKATLETNINVLNDTLDAITEAESQIRDTDFAEETANMTRAQILVQANMNTLGIANQIPNYMLSLLGSR